MDYCNNRARDTLWTGLAQPTCQRARGVKAGYAPGLERARNAAREIGNDFERVKSGSLRAAAQRFGECFSRNRGGGFLPDETRLGEIRLRTRDAKGLLRFYREVLGLKAVSAAGAVNARSVDGQDPALIVLNEDGAAPSRPPNAAGLFHVAFRYRSKGELAGAFLGLLKHRYPIEGASDHGVSEAIYLRDPDGNGVELYADRPRTEWVWREGQVAMSTEALDVDNLLASVGKSSAQAGTLSPPDLGHIHLRVTDLAQAERFFHEFLGLAVTQRSYPGALFFSAGGYHHHIAVNTWGSPAAAPPGSTGLISYRLIVPVPEILYCLKNRAPLLGYESIAESDSNGRDILKLRDPNGAWLEVRSI